MQIYFHSRLCSYLPRVPILVEGTVPSCLPTLKCVLWRQHIPVFGHNQDKQLSLWRSHWITGSLKSFKRLIRLETKQATVFMKESLNHWLTRFIQTAHLFRNEASNCLYEGVTESLARSIHSNVSFVQKRSKWLSLWRSHWIITSVN